MGAVIGSIVGSALLCIALGFLCRERRKTRRFLASKRDDAMARLSKTETGFPADAWWPDARSSFPFVSSQPVTLETISWILGRPSGPPDGAGDMQPRNETPEVEGRADLLDESGQDRHQFRESGSYPGLPTLHTATCSSPSLQPPDETRHALATSESLVSTNETPAPIPLTGQTAEYVAALQETIGALQLQVATLARAERAASVSTNTPPPAYEERGGETEAACA